MSIKRFLIEELEVELHRKPVKNVNVRIVPPKGIVKVSAPKHIPEKSIHDFLNSKMDWMRKAIQKVKAQESLKQEINYEDQSVHYLLGKPLKLELREASRGSQVSLKGDVLEVICKPNPSPLLISKLLENFYKKEMTKVVPALIAKYEPQMGVKVTEWRTRKAKTRWGSCHPLTGRIMLNIDLIRRPIEQLECVLVHEMCHLLEASHNHRFKALMTKYYPKWRKVDLELKKSRPLD